MWVCYMHIRVRNSSQFCFLIFFYIHAISVPENTTVAQVWALVVKDKSLPDNVLAAKNMEYIDLDTLVEEGDEIAFFPPVTGGGL